MKKSDVRKYAPDTPEYVVMHARYQQSRGRRPSVGFPWLSNPRLALEQAQLMVYFPKNDLYLEGKIPLGYACGKCGADDCKLWRAYNEGNVTLLCAVCAAKSQRNSIRSIDAEGCRIDGRGQRTNKIGSFIPAVPTEESNTYWGYFAIPQAGWEWWKKLPTLPLTAR